MGNKDNEVTKRARANGIYKHRREGQDSGIGLEKFSRITSFWSPFEERVSCPLLYLFLCACYFGEWLCGVDWLANTFTRPLRHIRILCVCPWLFIISVFLISSTEVRLEERSILERAGNVQSITVGLSPITVVLASVCTFSLHMALGYDLTAAEVFIYKNLQVSDKKIGKTNHKDNEWQLCFVVCIKVLSPEDSDFQIKMATRQKNLRDKLGHGWSPG